MRGGVHQRCGPVLCTPPHGWAYPAHTRASFRFTTTGTKGVPGLPPLDPLRGARCPPCGVAAPPNRVSTTKIDRFATLSWWANRSFFLLKLYRGSHFLLLIRGSAGGFGFCVLPEWHPFLGGAALAAAGGMIMPPQGEYPEGMAPSGRFFGDFLIGERVRQSLTPSPLAGRSACIKGGAQRRAPVLLAKC